MSLFILLFKFFKKYDFLILHKKGISPDFQFDSIFFM